MSITVGLTGQSGAGKTTASVEFQNAGFVVINCDNLAHEVVSASPCVDALYEKFGDQIIENGSFSRTKLSALVFSDKEKLSALNATVHPYITEVIKQKIAENKRADVIVLDAPTLFESGADSFCDIIVSVVCDYEIIINRICTRDNIDGETARKRISNQLTDDFFRAHSDIVIENTADIESFHESINVAVNKIKSYLK